MSKMLQISSTQSGEVDTNVSAQPCISQAGRPDFVEDSLRNQERYLSNYDQLQRRYSTRCEGLNALANAGLEEKEIEEFDLFQESNCR